MYLCVCVKERLHNACVNTELNKGDTSLVCQQHPASTCKEIIYNITVIMFEDFAGWMQGALDCEIMLQWIVLYLNGAKLDEYAALPQGCSLTLLSPLRSGGMACVLMGEPD